MPVTSRCALIIASLLSAWLAPAVARAADKPHWIWSSPSVGAGQTAFFRKTFQIDKPPKKALLLVSCDNHATVYLNGKKIGHSSEWQKPVAADVAKHLKAGANVLAVEAKNDDGPGGLIAQLQLGKNKKAPTIVSDASWKHGAKADGWNSAGFDEANWKAAATLGALGSGPWGNVFAQAGVGAKPTATDPKTINVPKGFKVELIHAVPKATQGSWVSLTVDPKGRLIASDQGGAGLFRITPPAIGSDDEAQVEKISKGGANFGGAQGMVHAFGSLYVNVNGGGSGVWRLTDTDGDDQYDKAEHIVPLRGGGEHGPHAVIVTEDGKGLYIAGGNHTDPPGDLTSSRVPLNYGEDLLLPRQWDARGHARGKLAPGGWVARISPDGKQRELVANGFRNEYDIALNAQGEMFTFDSDMEWDLGSPWYRPTRINHVVSGAEFGWRSGTGKWPDYYADSLPAVVNIGPASPTGVASGLGAKFPAKWQKAIYALDWTYGTIWAIHLKPDGATYGGDVQEFVSGKPLPVTDAIVGADGAFYFTIGGRGTQSALYRVTYIGGESTAALQPAAPTDAAKLRRSLEAFHGKKDPRAVDAALPHLGHDDRFVRYAARLALEHQPTASWKSRVLGLQDARAKIHGIIALARQGKPADRADAVAALNGIDLKAQPVETQLAGLRAYALVFIRLGKPADDEADAAIARLDPLYPARDDRLNAELSRVLVYLNAPNVVTKTMKLMNAPRTEPQPNWATVLDRNSGYGGTASKMLQNMPPLQKIHYAFVLRNVSSGWTLQQRRDYYGFFPEAAKRSGGASYQGFLKNIRQEAMANTSNAELQAVADLTGVEVKAVPKVEDLPQPKGPGKAWTKDELLGLIGNGLRKRNYENGKKMYAATMCILCHRFDGEGGSVGPDLSSVGNKFSYADLIDSILEPSKVISDQYGSTIITKKDGSAVAGRIVYTEGGKLYVSSNPLDPETLTEIPQSAVKDTRPADQSMMPPGLIFRLNKDEVLDLLAYLMSRGDKKDRVFR